MDSIYIVFSVVRYEAKHVLFVTNDLSVARRFCAKQEGFEAMDPQDRSFATNDHTRMIWSGEDEDSVIAIESHLII